MVTQARTIDRDRRHGVAAFIAVLFCLLTSVSIQVHAQALIVLHDFTGGADGANPYAGLTMDRGGNLYGTTFAGGFSGGGCTLYPGCGTIFKLSHSQLGWNLTSLFTFNDPNHQGANPQARVVFGPDGALYGTASAQGSLGNGNGVVFRLTPQPTVCSTTRCPWIETVIYSFGDPSLDGSVPGYGDVVFDTASNLYGTTIEGGGGVCDDLYTCGAVYELSRSGGSWSETKLFAIVSSNIPGFWPYPGVTLDNAGDLYGAATSGDGAVFQLTPNGNTWTSNVLYSFFNGSQGSAPTGGLIFDAGGNLYGTTNIGGPNNGGTVFELVRSGNQWTLNTLYAFSSTGAGPVGPTSTLVMDAGGNLYGTTLLEGDFGQGSVFKLTHSNGNWTLTTLHSFTGGADGGRPWGQVVLAPDGTIYGTATTGGSRTVGSCYLHLGCGVAFAITP